MSRYLSVLVLISIFMVAACSQKIENKQEISDTKVTEDQDFKYLSEKFADIKVLRFRVPGWENLNPKERVFSYYLYQAALSGLEITWDQHYKHNLLVKRTLENIVRTYKGERSGSDWDAFMVYTKRVWFSSGIHHHIAMTKIPPGFSKEYFAELVNASDQDAFPLQEGCTVATLLEKLGPIMFDMSLDYKRVNLDPSIDLVTGSANNFYEGVTEKEVAAYYDKVIDRNDKTPISYGLNSKMVKRDGEIEEIPWKVGGMYGAAIERVVFWLDKAAGVAGNETQSMALRKLIEYYQTGDLKKFDEYSILWVEDSESTVDVINGFIEVYGDALGYRATYESSVYFEDMASTERIKTLSRNAQWFEDNSPIMDQHKKDEVKGISARVINEVVGAGAVSPSAPIGINLPNANWIRANYGSKSVTIGNFMTAFDEVIRESGIGEEFTLDPERLAMSKKYGDLASSLDVDLHEVIGHASGKIEPGVGTPKETLKNYSSTIEETRADLVALYYVTDPKLIEWGLAPGDEVGRVAYDHFITNGLLVQLARVEKGQDIEEAHMRNRALIAGWAYEMGKENNVIEKVVENGKTYFVIRDYAALRDIFGQQLREIQRVKSQGDFARARELIETYGVKVDPAIHAEVLERYGKLGVPPYSGFINPLLEPVEENGKVVDAKISYPDNFAEQMLYYAKEYSFLTTYN